MQSGDLPVVPSPLAQSHSWSHKRVLTAHVLPNRTELAVDTHDCLWLLTQGCERGRAWHLKQSPPAHGGATVAVEHLVRNAAHFVVVVPRQLGAGTDVPETGGDWSGVAKATHNIDTNNAAQLVNRHQPEATQRRHKMSLKHMETGRARAMQSNKNALLSSQRGSARQISTHHGLLNSVLAQDVGRSGQSYAQQPHQQQQQQQQCSAQLINHPQSEAACHVITGVLLSLAGTSRLRQNVCCVKAFHIRIPFSHSN